MRIYIYEGEGIPLVILVLRLLMGHDDVVEEIYFAADAYDVAADRKTGYARAVYIHTCITPCDLPPTSGVYYTHITGRSRTTGCGRHRHMFCHLPEYSMYIIYENDTHADRKRPIVVDLLLLTHIYLFSFINVHCTCMYAHLYTIYTTHTTYVSFDTKNIVCIKNTGVKVFFFCT